MTRTHETITSDTHAATDTLTALHTLVQRIRDTADDTTHTHADTRAFEATLRDTQALLEAIDAARETIMHARNALIIDARDHGYSVRAITEMTGLHRNSITKISD